MADKKIGVGVVVDASEAQDGFKRVGEASREMAKVVKQSGVEAGKGLDGVGAGGDEAAAKLDRATKSIINSIQRTTTQLEAGGKASSKYYELLASQRNLNVDALKPYIDQLKAVEGAQTKVGISAAQTSAAMRNVPAQFTDIVTSIQGGQKPLTVLLQQGGQLKDMFGGVAPAAKALGSYVLGLVNPFTVAAAAVGGLGYVYAQADDRAREFSKSIILSGNAAGTSADQLLDLTRRISDAGAGSRSLASDALNGLVASGNVTAQMLDKAAQASIKGQKYLGISIEDNTKAFSDLGKTPVKALDALNEKYNFLTVEIYKQVKALEDQGKTTEAAKVAQNAYADAIESRSESVKKTLTGWAALWNDIKEGASAAGDAVVHAFDSPTLREEMGVLSKQRGQLVSALQDAQDNGNKDRAAQLEKALKDNFLLLQLYSEKEASLERQTAAEVKKNEAEKAGLAFLKQGEQFLSKKAQQEREIAEATQLRATATGKNAEELKKDEELTQRIAAIKEKYKESVSKEASAYATLSKNISEKLELSRLEITADKPLTESQKLRVKLMELIESAHGKISKAQVDEQVKKLDLIKSNELARNSYDQLTKDLENFRAKLINKDIVDAMQKQSQEFLRMSNAADEYAQTLSDNGELLALEASLMGENSVARNTAIEQFRTEIALRKELRAIDRSSMSEGEKNLLRDKANENANVAKSQAALRAQQEEWTKFYADIYNGLSDSLYRGFEAGKGFFQNFWDGIKNLFKTTVLKLAVQGVMTGVFGGLAGSAGASTLPAAITSGANLLQVGKSIYDGFSLAASAGAGVSAIGNLLGSSAISAFGAGMGLSSSAASAAAGAYSAAGMGSTASAISAGSVVGTALPWVAGAALLYKGLSYGDKQMSGQTVTGTLGTQDLMRNVSWTQKGGLFRSDRSGVWSYGLKDSTAIQDGKAYQDTANVANDSSMLKFLNDSYSAIKTATEGFAKTLGLNAEEIAKRNDAINVTLGSTKEETDAAIQKALGGVADSIAASLLPNFKELAKEGETAAGTLARVAVSFGSVNTTLDNIGLKLFQLNDAGIKAASSFADLFGGLEGLQTASAAYYDNFFSQEEKTANALKAVGAEFDKLSLGTLPSTRAEYRKLVEDISKTGNAEQLAGLLKLSGAFAAVVPDAQAVVEKVDQTNDALSRFTSATDAAASPLVRVSSALDDTAEAAQKAASILAERNNLQDQIDAAAMTSAQLLEKQRNALDESNRAKFDELQVALATKQKADALAQTNKGILDQIESLVKANETVEQARARELKGVDESTAALKRRLYALQDEAQAQADLKARQEASTANMNSMINAVIEGSAATQKSLKAMVESMTNARDALITGAQSSFSIEDRLALLKGQMGKASDAELPALSNSYLSLLKESGASTFDYQREFASIVNRLDNAAVTAAAQYQENAINEPARLAAWAGILAEDKKKADVRDAFNSEYSTYAKELPVLSVNGFSSNSLAWGDKLTEAMGSFSTNSDETNKALLAEIKALREASEKTAALLDSVTAGGNAMLTEGA